MTKLFTIEQANRSLVYVTKVVEDVRSYYRIAVECQEKLDAGVPADDEESVRQAYHDSIKHLDRYVDELHNLGLSLMDYELGMVHLPFLCRGKPACFCWKTGESSIEFWHFENESFAQRKPVSELTTEMALV